MDRSTRLSIFSMLKLDITYEFRGLLRKAVIPVAGLGTRLLPTTKEILPIFLAERSGLVIKQYFM
ncbi:MAG: hypothetical protein DRJ49_07935 [Thermoprotei archaeon]|nr:MAG: hypothetical protein DRJ49_07935 [Thermoprotei archaeon]